MILLLIFSLYKNSLGNQYKHITDPVTYLAPVQSVVQSKSLILCFSHSILLWWLSFLFQCVLIPFLNGEWWYSNFLIFENRSYSVVPHLYVVELWIVQQGKPITRLHQKIWWTLLSAYTVNFYSIHNFQVIISTEMQTHTHTQNVHAYTQIQYRSLGKTGLMKL
jgi:hypothetical protein